MAWNHQLVQFCHENATPKSRRWFNTWKISMGWRLNSDYSQYWFSRLSTLELWMDDGPNTHKYTCLNYGPNAYREFIGRWQMIPRFVGFLWVNEWPIAIGGVGCCSRIPTLGWCAWDMVSLVLGWWWVVWSCMGWWRVRLGREEAVKTQPPKFFFFRVTPEERWHGHSQNDCWFEAWNSFWKIIAITPLLPASSLFNHLHPSFWY